ncbi:hypothetical protein P0082_03515 [Candidatus Haliotispira prima]|uniref:SbsA Ig-like domain-containing protein n=1 Tax=Candidatus Haliotispira prima TaxID=3034016 RepID=A0ABY8MK29_9SPIO|nr:hypothetical protein P0082_03515 [Candidatus Haliotispira prima]
MASCAPLSDDSKDDPPTPKYTAVTFPYIGANELTFSITSELEGEIEFTFGISASNTTSLPAQLGKGYIKRTLTKDVGREVFMAHLNTIPDDISTLTADHLLKENTTYYLNIYRGRELASQKSFTTAKFATLPTLERRQEANNIGMHFRDQYSRSNGEITDTGTNTVGIPRTSTEISAPQKIEVKEEEYLILPTRVAFPIFPEPSPVTSSEEVNLHLVQVKARNSNTFNIIFTFFGGSEAEGTTNAKTVFLERKTKSTNFDVYFTAIMAILPSDPVSQKYFLGDGLEIEHTVQYNLATYSGQQKIRNVQLITQ